MKEILRRSSVRHVYLFVVAVWLFVLSFLFSATWSYRSSPESIREKFEQYIEAGEQRFEEFAADKQAIKDLTGSSPSAAKAYNYLDDNTGLYVYTRNDVGNFLALYWNTNKLAPQTSDLSLPDGKHLVVHSNGEFEFLKRTVTVNNQLVTIAGLVPLRLKYFVSNRYLSTNFPALKNIGDNYDVVTDGGGIKIRNGEGKVLFGLKELKKTTEPAVSMWSVACKTLAVIFFLVFINMIAYDVALGKGWKTGFGFLVSLLFILRALSYYFDFPFPYRQLDLFDPAIYASNSLHPSLGDLLINILLVFWLISFVKYTALAKMKQYPVYRDRKSVWVCIVISVLLLVISFTCAGIIRSLIVDSKISYDVANFFRLNVYTLISFIILCFITLSFFNLSHLLLLHLYKCEDIPQYLPYLSVTIAGLFYLTINAASAAMESNMVVMAWLLVFMLIMQFRRSDIYIPLIRSSFFLPWLMFFTACTSALIIYQSRSVDMEERKSYAERLAEQSDPSAQTSLNIALNSFSNESFLAANFHRFREELDNKAIKDSLINQNFQGYLNKYDTRIYTYDSNYNGLFNEDPISYELVSNILNTQGKKTNIPGVYYFENAFDRFSYLYHKEVRNSDSSVVGHLVIFADPKKYKSDALFPELFRQSRDIAFDYDINTAYAIYHNGQIIQNSGDYDFASVIPRQQFPKSDFVVKKRKGFSELWFNAGNNKLLILVKSASVAFQSVTLFAYLFGTYLFLIVLFHLAIFLVRTRFTWWRIKASLRMNFRRQIQSAIVFISLFSFIVIGVATISFYIVRFRKTNRDRLVKSITIMANEVNSQVASHVMFDDALRLYDLGPRSQLEKSIDDIAEIHSIDVNFYDLSGNLVISTQPYIYRKQILSGMMEPKAFHGLHYENKIQFIQDEHVGEFQFLSIYVPIRDPQGNPYAYLNVPYLSSQAELNQEISTFLVTLINLNAFIFLFAGAISLLLTNRITRSFTLIADKMKKISLGAANEQLQWEADDEIGTLVTEYNKMVSKLEQSAEALAKSEREGAWREMARQVAHEIKNPLTPMKLSIQYLQRSIQDKSPDIQALSQKVAATLVEQIDQLAKIASDFSQFANIGHVQFQRFDVNEVISSLVNLYGTNERLQIKWQRPARPAIIDADRTQINRLFTNLLQNAIEASAGKEIVPIEIEENYSGNKLQVSVIDHGAGISIEKQSKIFTPNFTTKSSGTGLGLAICKGIVEKANGKMWFETEEGQGTKFHVLLPLVNLPG